MWIPEDIKEDIDYQMSMTIDDDPMIVSYGNPYNPFTDFKGWWKYDYFLCWDVSGLLARNVADSEGETDTQRSLNALDAMRQLVLNHPRMFRIVKKSDYDDPKTYKKIIGPYGGAA